MGLRFTTAALIMIWFVPLPRGHWGMLGVIALVSATLQQEYAALVAELVRAKRDMIPLSKIDVNELTTVQPARTPSDTALLRYTVLVVYLTVDNVEAEKAAGTRADARPFIPGSGSGG